MTLPDLRALALILLLGSHGARTPLIALLAFRRPRNLALLLAPFVALGTYGILLAVTLPSAHGTGVVALVGAPALLVAPLVAARFWGQRELAALLVLGTLGLCLLAYAAAGPRLAGAAALAGPAGAAFVIAAALAAAVPFLRDPLYGVLGGLAGLASLALIGLAAVESGPLLDPFAFLLAGIALGLGVAAAALVVSLTGREPVAAVLGAGVRDPGIAAAVALAAGGPLAGTVPLAYAVLLGCGLVLLAVVRKLARP